MTRVPLTKLKPAPWNPRILKDARFQNLCKSIEADPGLLDLRPILATKDGTIYGGNQRFRAVQHLGWTDVPAELSDIPELLAKERALKDNGAWGEWVDDDLGTLLAELKDAGSDIDLLGFDSPELDRLLKGVTQVPEEDDADLTPPAEPITKPGDLWLLGGKPSDIKDSHRLLCGDSTNLTDVERLMNGRKAALLWTDPPYGVSYVGKTADALTIDNDGAEGLPALLQGVFTNAVLLLEEGSPFYVAHPPGVQHIAFWLAAIDSGWQIHQELIWLKDTMVLGHSDYHFKHEPILYGWMPGAGRSGRGDYDGSRWHGDHSQVSVLDFPRPKRSEEHPTMKPPDLIAYCIQNSSQRGDLVLDLFGGSGSTLIAAEQTDRIAYLMEIDPGYCDVIVNRWQKLTGKTAVLAGSQTGSSDSQFEMANHAALQAI